MREHRHKNIDGSITITPFTAQEEADTDQREADLLAATTLFNSKPERIKRITEGDDLKIVVFKMIFNLHNRSRIQEGQLPITVDDFLKFLEGELI